MSSDLDEQQDEVLALVSIFDPEEFVRNETKTSGEFRVSVELPVRFTVALKQDTFYEVSSLPPLRLTFDLPEDYPSCSPPTFTLSCSWLTPKQLSSLTAQLSDLYHTAGGAVVLFSWAQFLKHETLSFLGIAGHLEIPSNGDTSGNGDSTTNLNLTFEENELKAASAPSEAADTDGGASNFVGLEAALTPERALLSELLIHDAAQREKAFAKEQFECGVCFVSWLGSECVQLVECGHVFCRTCLAEFCKFQIQSGNVREVTCAQTDCKSAPTPAQVMSLVGEELFSRYDRLLLQSTLDSMPDVVYCPRPSCASAVLSESSSSMALCTVCSFAFCVLCKKTYHGAGACYTPPPSELMKKNKSYIELPKSQEGRKALWDDYSSAGRDRQKLLEDRYGRQTMLEFLGISLSVEWIHGNSKKCPHCFSRIQKIGGCNYMTCALCRRSFCWACLARSPSYEHWTDGCPIQTKVESPIAE